MLVIAACLLIPVGGGMAVPNSNWILDTLYNAGFRGDSLRTAYGIVMRESKGNPRAFNPNASTGDRSYGLFQINMLGSLGPSRMKQFGLKSYEDLYDPAVNARAAFRLSKGGKDFGAWGIGPNAYRAGAGYDTIKQFVDQFPADWQPPGKRTPTAAKTVPTPTQAVNVPAYNEKVTIRDLNRLARRFGFKSWGQAFGLDDDGEVAKVLGPRLRSMSVATVATVGKNEIPVVNATGQRNVPKNVQSIVTLAKQFLGTPYQWGAAGPDRFDCSGFAKYLYARYGVDLPHYTVAQFKMGKPITRMKDLREGDLVFFNMGTHKTTGEYGPQHMGIYIGNGQFIHAPRTGDVVKISNLTDRDDFVGGRRYL